MRLSREAYAVELAKAAALRSEDPYHRVGCALMRADGTVAAMGYNGAPPGVELDWTDRDGRRRFVVHAEANALRYVQPGEVALLATTMMSCLNCVLTAASYRIPRIIYVESLDPAVYDIRVTEEIAADCGIQMERFEA
jgi:dCMP deaminase